MVGLASSAGAGLPVITGGCQCHTWVGDAAFDGVNAVAGLTEPCCGPYKYWGQSRPGAAAALAPAVPAWATSTVPTSPSAVNHLRVHLRRPNLRIVHPLGLKPIAPPERNRY